MRSLVVVLLALIGYCHARPSFDAIARPTLTFDSYILGGQNAEPGEFPWQLSQQRLSGGTWSHSCGASLLSSKYALSAAHCVDGAAASAIRVVAGTNDRTDITVVSNAESYKMHELYGSGPGTYPNDIAIITLAVAIEANGGTIQYASLPRDNSDNFAGRIGVLSGWGRTSASNVLPVNLQKVSISIIDTARCNTLLQSVSGATATDNMICLYDSNTQAGSCNGDSGGPLNVNYPTADDSYRVVAGVTSWGIQSGGACAPSFPSVYTRTSTYLDWIRANAPN